MVEWAVLQLLSYPLLNWLLFVGIALAASFFGGWVGIIPGHYVIALVVLLLDIDYATTHEYMDMDIVFTMGVLFRIVLINTVLLPVSAAGLLVRRRRKEKAKSSGAADEVEDGPEAA
jgi:hypothetical protein